MNYNDEILENKAFDWFKQLMYNIVVAICILLAVFLVLVYGFKFTPYNVITGSMEPVLWPGDMIVVKSQSDYEIGDILTFNNSIGSVTHRIVAIVEYNGVTYYACHGDNVGDVYGGYEGLGEWEDDAAYLEGKSYAEVSAAANIQMVTISEIEGKVVAVFNNWGTYFTFISDHKWLFIAIVVAIWGISATFQIESDIRRKRRMFN